MRAQTPESVRVLRRINAEFVDWVSQQAKPARWLHKGQVETFFGNFQVEVKGHQFEGARINYEGNRALSWQTLWFGPWMLDGILDSATDVSEHLGVLLDGFINTFAGKPNYFYADSGSSAGKFLNRIEQADFSRWSVSYNKWTGKLDRLAAELPNSVECAAARRPAPGTIHMDQAPTRGMRAVGTRFATVQCWKNEGDLMWRYA